MCGILGVVAGTDQSLPYTDSDIETIRDSMTYRGPDDAGLLRVDDRAIFAHRRLAIRDLEHGQQPWTTKSGNGVLVYNGELYDVDKLRSKIDDHQWESTCDTEVLAEWLARHDQTGLSELRGMFAFGYYDKTTGKLLLTRDRCGVKPLYYSYQNGNFYFASSLAALLQFPEVSCKIDQTAVVHYLLTLRTNWQDQSLVSSIKVLEPGQWLTFDGEQIETGSYWELPPDIEEIEPEESERRLETGLQEANQLRLVSDVPVGMMLSGGVDSSLLGTFIREEVGNNLVAQCGVGVGAGSEDESSFAEQAAQELECQFSLVEVTAGSYLEGWQELISLTGQPLSTPSDVIIYRLAQSLKEKVGVVLGGEGADELLCGYGPIHGIGYDFDHLRLLKREAPAEKATEFEEALIDTYGISSPPTLAKMYLTLATVFPPQAVAMLLPQGEKLCRQILEGYTEQLQFNEDDPQGGFAAVSKLLHRVNLVALLNRLDAATMAASLEARVPYTDHYLIEALWTTPWENRFRVNTSLPTWSTFAMELIHEQELEPKSILRAVARKRLPAELANRQKASFPTPVQQWMLKDWKDWIDNRLRSSPFLKQHFHRATLVELIDHPEESGILLWPLLNLAIWGDQFAAQERQGK